MIELREIKVIGNLKKYVELSYSGDNDLLEKFHVLKYELKDAVEATMQMIKATSTQVQMAHFGIVLDGERIGYLSIFKNNLYSFGINVKYRTKEVLSKFWDEIKTILGGSFICMLFQNNTRAIEWLKRCGMKIVDGVEETAVTLIYHKIKTT